MYAARRNESKALWVCAMRPFAGIALENPAITPWTIGDNMSPTEGLPCMLPESVNLVAAGGGTLPIGREKIMHSPDLFTWCSPSPSESPSRAKLLWVAASCMEVIRLSA